MFLRGLHLGGGGMDERFGKALCAVAWLSCAAAAPGTATAAEPRCRGNPGVIGRCYWIRGEFALSADSLFIVDRDDNGRWVVIRNAHNSRGGGPVDHAVPRNLEMSYNNAVSRTGSVGGVRVRGDFEVCPIPNQGWFADQAFACIQSATHLRRVSPNWMSPAQKRLHDQFAASLERDQARAAAAEKKGEAEAVARETARRSGLTPP